MKKRHIFWLSFPLICLTIWWASVEIKSRTLPTVMITAEGYDPRNLLSGHYLLLQLDWDKTDCKQFADNKCPKQAFTRAYRFYLDEHHAKTLNRKFQNSELKLELEFAYKPTTTPLLKELYINNTPWKTWITQNP